MYRVLKYSLPVFLLCLFSCEVKLPENIIRPDKLEALLYDYHLVQAMSSDAGADYERKLYAEYVFNKHGVTKEEFDTAMVWYTRNPKYLYKIYGSLHDKMVAEVDEMSGGSGTPNSSIAFEHNLNGDTVNLWQNLNIELLSSASLRNNLQFSYDADTTYRVGDSITFGVDILLISPEERNIIQNAYAALMLEYSDSTYDSKGVRIGQSGHYNIALKRNFNSEIKNIRGYIYYSDNDSLYESKMLASEISVVRIHARDDEMDFE